MKHTLVATAFFFLVGAGQAYAQTAVPGPSAPEPKFGAARVLGELKVAGVDAAAERADDAQKFADGGYVSGRVRYALSQPVQQWLEPAAAGDSAGSFAWNISSPGATSLDLVFSHFWLPRGVSVYVYDSSREWVRGPYTDQHNNAQNVLPMPFVPGDSLTIEVTGDPAALAHAKLKVGQVSSGYREFWKPGELQKSGACNVDVACPDRSTWEDQIASVGHFTFQSGGSSFVCSGQMLNTTSNDDRIFSSANHCLSTEAEANSVVVYFNYESDQCRAPGSVSSGQAISRGGFTDTIEGTSLLSTYAPSDFTLLRLNQTPPASYNVFYSGWDHTGNGVAGVAGIHHPAGHAKRISFDFDELCKSPYLGGCDGSSTHWRIAAWDTGTTEGGSSGSGIWNNNGLFVGQLEGGFAACSGGTAQDNDQPDWYGRMDVSWTGNGTPSGRMSDWLDPTNTGAMTFNGRSGCDAPQVQMSSTKGGVFSVGESADFSAAVSGGQAPYTFSWDVDGDGLTDSTDANVSAIYHEPFSGTVTVGIIDGAGCRSSASLGAVVEAPALDLSQVGQPAEVCGDGDSQIEPGESWSYPVTLRNSGSASAVDTFAAFAPAGGASGAAKRFGGPDSFGYTFADSQEPSCSFSFQDIAGTGTQLNFTATDGNQAAAEDDGWADVTLGGTGFDFYGTNLTGVTVSTNGYISTSQQDIGGDVSNDCPLPTAVSSGTGGRIYPLHDDVVIQTAYHQYFENCPRPGESAGSAGCNIFQWNVDGFFGGPSSPNFDFQAILYDGTNQIVYQYGPGNGRQGDSQTIGIQSQANPPFDGLTYACNEPNSVPDNSAVCIFHPSADSPGLSGDIQLERSALAVGAVGSGGSSQVDVTVQLNESFACGDSFSVDYLGSVHAGGFSSTGSASVISGQVAQNCDVITSCQGDSGPTVAPRQGFWFNALRPGNGIEVHFAGDQLYSAWYTAEKNRLPLWYYVQSIGDQSLVNDTVTADIFRFQLSGDIRQNTPVGQVVGQARISFLNESEAVMTFEIDGESSGELLSFFDLSSTADVDPVTTDQYFNGDEGGWGIGTHRQGDQEFSAVYFYDTQGQPRWVVVASDGTVLNSQGSADLASFKAHCPGCTWTTPSILTGGTMERTINGDSSQQLDSMDVQVGGDVEIQWQRSNLPLQQITPPN